MTIIYHLLSRIPNISIDWELDRGRKGKFKYAISRNWRIYY